MPDPMDPGAPASLATVPPNQRSNVNSDFYADTRDAVKAAFGSPESSQLRMLENEYLARHLNGTDLNTLDRLIEMLIQKTRDPEAFLGGQRPWEQEEIVRSQEAMNKNRGVGTPLPDPAMRYIKF